MSMTGLAIERSLAARQQRTVHAFDACFRALASSTCRPNGSDAKLHGQGPRAEAGAARGAPHVRRANARRVTP